MVRSWLWEELFRLQRGNSMSRKSEKGLCVGRGGSVEGYFRELRRVILGMTCAFLAL